jgi:molybdopterin-guanine dinucleotide biosynthesis protein A
MLGAILAGGLSTRMGTDKSRLCLNHRPVLEILIEQLRNVCTKTVLVARDVAQKNALPQILHVEILCDLQAGCGPLGGLYTALSSTNDESVLLLGCDLPFVEVALLQRMSDEFHRHRPLILLPRTTLSEGSLRSEPLCAIWSKALLPQIETALQKQRLSLFRLAEEVGAYPLDLTPDESLQLRNINTTSELGAGLGF